MYFVYMNLLEGKCAYGRNRLEAIEITQQLSYLSEYEGDKLLGLPVAGMDDMREGRERKEGAAVKVMGSFKGVVNPVR